MAYVNGDRVDADLFVMKSSVEKTKTNKSYINFSCRAEDGTVYENCKKWDDAIALTGVVHIIGSVELFNDALQIKVASWTKSSRPASDFTPKAPWPISKEAVNAIILEAIRELPDGLAEYTLGMLGYWDTHEFPSRKEVPSRFFTHPGGQKIHHAYQHGLIEHTQEVITNIAMLGSANALNNREMDLAVAGAAIHDIGKLDEYRLYDGVYDYSPVGRAYGWNSNAHLYIGSGMLTLFNETVAEHKLVEEDFLLLQNIVLGHHCQYADAKTLHRATMVVHMADNASAQLNRMRTGLAKSSTGIVENDATRQNYIAIKDYPSN